MINLGYLNFRTYFSENRKGIIWLVALIDNQYQGIRIQK